MLTILTLLAGLSVGALLPALLLPGVAAAHTCVTQAEVYVDQLQTVTVGVAAEDLAPVVSVDITIPDGFTFDSFVPSQDPRSSQWRGGVPDGGGGGRGGGGARGGRGVLFLEGG